MKTNAHTSRRLHLLAGLACLVFILTLSVYSVAIEPSGPSKLHADDPLAEVDPLVKASDEAIARAVLAMDKIAKTKTELDKAKDLKKANQASVKAFNDLLETLSKGDLALDPTLKAYSDATADLAANDKKIDALIVKVKALPTSPTVEAAVKKLQDQKKKVGDKTTDLTKAKEGLADPTNAVYKSLDTVALDLIDQIQPFNAQEETVPALLKSLPDQLPKMVAVHSIRVPIEKTATPLQVQLKKLTSTPLASVPTNLNTADAQMTTALNRVGSWLEILGADTDASRTALIDMRLKLDENLQQHSVLAVKMLDGTEERERIIGTISTLARDVGKKAELAAIVTKSQLLDAKVEKLKSGNNLVRDGLAGDFGRFVNDFVSLYYFTDVPNLMKVLNPDARELRDVSALRDEAIAARKALDRADLDLREAQDTVSGLQIRKRNLIAELNDAENDFSSSTNLLAQAQRRLSRFGDDDPTRRSHKDRVDDLTVKKADDEKRYNALKDETNGLPAKIREAESALQRAQTLAEQTKSRLILLVQDESFAFAKARDNEPVYFARNDATSKDPLKRVIIYAFGSRKIMYLRGTKEDVYKAKTIIAFFDRPAPQARLALWTLELNGKATKKGSQEFNKSLQELDGQLSNTRSQIAVALSYLRKCINERVNQVADGEIARLGRSYPRDSNGANVDVLRWARSFFYQDEVLTRLGFDRTIPLTDRKSDAEQKDQAKIMSWNTLPDPAGAGTLGEALVILALAKPVHRDAILNDFTANVSGQINQVIRVRSNARSATQSPQNYSFENLRNALDQGGPSTYTPIQKEIVNSITLASVPRLLRRLQQMGLEGQPRKGSSLNDREKQHLTREISSVVDFLWYAYGISSTDLLGYDAGPEGVARFLVDNLLNTPANSPNPAITGMSARLVQVTKDKNIYRLANAQIAKTDNLVKQLIDAFEEDVNLSIVQPTIYGLRTSLVGKKVGVGIISRTTVLATNRLVARVDARGSAQLTVGEEQDALLAAQQLANLFLAAKTGGILGGLSGLKGVQQERETSEVYGINSGSVFKVTPVFDPSGQALRFQFDHTMANMVTEPDGSIEPALPRIERHTVNTEVQLANLELREISRFESNAKLGIPTTYKGGVPIFRDIPYVNKVPLLGWFVRRSGKAAVIQESLVLGQTTMYPTIADMFDLLSGDDYNIDQLDRGSEVRQP